MGIADEIEKLEALRNSGVLSEHEFTLAKRRLLDGGSVPAPGPNPLRQFTRSTSDCWIGGVCGGLGKLTPLPSWGWRLGFCLAMLAYGFGLLPYALLWIFVPQEQDANASPPR